MFCTFLTQGSSSKKLKHQHSYSGRACFFRSFKTKYLYFSPYKVRKAHRKTKMNVEEEKQEQKLKGKEEVTNS